MNCNKNCITRSINEDGCIKLQEYLKWFNTYVKKFDMKSPEIMDKFHHTYRVMGYAKEIAISLDMNDHDIWLCEMIALFHDLGRFEQWTKYHTFYDKQSIDHGELSSQILQEFNVLKKIIDEDKNIIYTAISNHNQYQIDTSLDGKTIKFCKIIRDADQIDIMIEQGNVIKEMEDELNPNLLSSLYKKQLCSDQYLKTSVDHILRIIGFIFDLNFNYSFQILLDKNVITNKFHLVKNYVKNVEAVEKLEEFVITYMKEREHVR